METANLRVHAIAWTAADLPLMHDVSGGRWEPDTAGEGSLVAEFAGRACYQSWSKPNPATASNAGYLRHILDVGHGSVLEHGVATMYVTGVSRSLTHELIRHRHFSYSQLSQRYVPEGDARMVVPDVIAADPDLLARFEKAADDALAAYRELYQGLADMLADHRAFGEHRSTTYLPLGSNQQERCRECDTVWPCQPARTAARKAARQAARSVLPNATETRIVVTGNYRAWRHFIDMRATEHADVEIRALAVACLRELHRIAPNVFADYQLTRHVDDTETAHSPLSPV